MPMSSCSTNNSRNDSAPWFTWTTRNICRWRDKLI